jgi:endonuclease/exonuclease/phosphatase family metal-dependent hydrolase
MLLVEVEQGPSALHVLVTHLDRVQDRAAQLDRVTAEFLSLPEPALLMGDLNTTADDPQLARLLAEPGVRDLVAEGLGPKPPPVRIDWILGRGLRALQAGVVDTRASDHPLVWAEVEVAR